MMIVGDEPVSTCVVPPQRGGRQLALIGRLAKIALEKLGQLVKWDEVHPVVEIDVTGARHQEQLFGFGRALVRVLAELDRAAWSPAINSTGRGEIVSICANG